MNSCPLPVVPLSLLLLSKYRPELHDTMGSSMIATGCELMSEPQTELGTGGDEA